jgi:micrococcal nuclease
VLRTAVALLAALALGGCAMPEAPPLRSTTEQVRLDDALPVPDGAQQAVVVRITDGDTVRLRGRGVGPVPGESTRVRLLLIDTPEVSGDSECYGPEATDRLAELLPVGSTARVQPDADLVDRYGRLLLHVWNADGVHVGEVLVAEGYATVLQIDPNRRHLERFEALEEQAREAGRGLWSACS